MSQEVYAHHCTCKKPKMGFFDSDTDTVYCDCDGDLAGVDDIDIEYVSPLSNCYWLNDRLKHADNCRCDEDNRQDNL